MNLVSHVKAGAFLWTDDHSSYNSLTEKPGSKKEILSTHEEYDKVNHLNSTPTF